MFPYIISFRAIVAGKIDGHPLTVAANCMHVPVITAQRYLHLNFDLAYNARAFYWVWQHLIHPYPGDMKQLSVHDVCHALLLMKHLGIPLHSMIGKRWLIALTRVPLTTVPQVVIDDMVTHFPHAWFNSTLTAELKLRYQYNQWRYKEFTTISSIIEGWKSLDMTKGFRIYLNNARPLVGVSVIEKDGKWTVISKIRMLRISYDPASRRWFMNDMPINIRFYDTNTLCTPTKIYDPETRMVELRVTTSSGDIDGDVSVTVGDTILRGSLHVMKYVSPLIMSLVEDTGDIPSLLPYAYTRDEMYNMWIALHGGAFVIPYDLSKAWFLSSYFAIPVDHLYVVGILKGMIGAKTPGVASKLLQIPLDKRKDIDLFHCINGETSVAERAIYSIVTPTRSPLSYPFVEYEQLSYDELVISDRSTIDQRWCGTVYVMLYEKDGPVYKLINPLNPDAAYAFCSSSTGMLFRVDKDGTTIQREFGRWWKRLPEVHPGEKMKVAPLFLVAKGYKKKDE